MPELDPSPMSAELLERTLTSDELEDLTSPDPSPASVTYSTQDFDIRGLVQRLDRKSMLIPSYGQEDDRLSTAGFQRGFVWTKVQMDRFIESLLLGYPIPGIFLVKQSTDNRLLVLDGQQRLVTLQRYYSGLHNGREFVLDYVGPQFKGLAYNSLDESMQFQLDDSYLQATIVSADGSDEVNEAVYQIFERLNSGGTQLTPHEIRVALYAGPLIEFLERLNRLPSWRKLYGGRSIRIRDQELVLRIIALYLDSGVYSRPLKAFLNGFVSRNRRLRHEVERAGDLFIQAADVLAGIGPQVLRRPNGSQVNVAQTEAIFVAMMKAVEGGQSLDGLQASIAGLVADDAFATATTRATADREAVTDRLALALSAIAS